MTSVARRCCIGLLLAMVVALAGCGEKKAKVDLQAQVAKFDGDVETKVMALAEVATLGPDAASAVPQITPLLKDEDATVRRTAAYALGQIGPAAKSAIPELKEMLNTDDQDQLRAVANAINAIDPTAMPGLKIENVMN